MKTEDMGAILKAERERRGLSLDDIVNQLKINSRLLRAIEEGDTANLPPPAYIKGFIRSYARLLNINENDLHVIPGTAKVSPLSSQAEETSKNVESQSAPVETAHKMRSEPAVPAQPTSSDSSEEKLEMGAPVRRPGPWRKIFAFLTLFCAIVGGIWWAKEAGHFEFMKKEKVAPASLDESLPPADKYLAARDAMQAQAVKEQVDISRPEPPQDAVPQPQTLAPADQQIQAEEVVPKEQLETPSQHKLIITAIEECWVHSNADKSDTRQFSLRKGDSFALTFAKSLELKLGNAGGVKLRYDGEDLGAPGTSGQVKSLSFPPERP